MLGKSESQRSSRGLPLPQGLAAVLGHPSLPSLFARPLLGPQVPLCCRIRVDRSSIWVVLKEAGYSAVEEVSPREVNQIVRTNQEGSFLISRE